MKRSLIALGIIAAAVSSVANAAPTVYGKLNLSLDNIKDDTKNSVWQVDSNASRFGVKGENELTPSLSAVYYIEWEVNAAGSAAPYNPSTDLKARNRYLGLKNQDLGTLKLGQFDTYTKALGQGIDLWADQLADNSNVLAGKTRLANVVGYESPKFAGFNFNLLFQPGQTSQAQTTVAPPGVTPTADHGLANAFSTSLVYANDDLGLTAGLAYDKNVMDKFAIGAAPSVGALPAASGSAVSGTGQYTPADSVGTARTNLLRLVGGYNIKPIGLSFNLEVQRAERAKSYNFGAATAAQTTKPKENGFLFNTAWKFAEGWTGKLQYAASTTKFDDTVNKDIKLSQTTLGADYNFTSTTKVYGFYSILTIKNDNNPVTAPVVGQAFDQNEKLKIASVGIEHKF
jgi:predicted porin